MHEHTVPLGAELLDECRGVGEHQVEVQVGALGVAVDESDRFVGPEEDVEAAARRGLLEETGIQASRFLEQLKTYGAPGRDPRGRTVSVAFLAIAADLGDAVGGSDAAAAGWHPLESLLADPTRLAFDHGEILADALERARGRLEWTPLAIDFVDDEFTIADLRHVYEVIWDLGLDPANFRRKVTRASDFVVETGRTADPGRGRPAQLYRRGDAERIYPAAEPLGPPICVVNILFVAPNGKVVLGRARPASNPHEPQESG